MAKKLDNGKRKLEEDVNQGLNGAPKGKVGAGHGQNSDSSGEHDKLIPETLEQKDPYRAKGSDFPVKNVMARHGQSGSHGTAEGMDALAHQSETQCGVRHNEDGGAGEHGSGTPSEWGKGGKQFTVEVNKGESEEEGKETSIPESVNLMTGYLEGGSRTRVQEVPQYNVKIPSR